MRAIPKKAFLLAAGEGTRLRPLTNTTPKCLLPIRGIPMLQIWLARCKAVGVQEILINLHAHADAVEQFLRRNPVNGIHVQISDEPTLLGSAGTILSNCGWVRDEPAFWVFYADVLTDVDLQQMVKFHQQQNPVATIGVYRVPDPSRCGIVQMTESGWVTEFIEKPKVPSGNLAFAGILLAGVQFLEALPEKKPADIGFDVLPKLVGRMVGYKIEDYLIDIGTIENYQLAQKNWSPRQPLSAQERRA